MRVSINDPGWRSVSQSVYISPTESQLLFSRRKRWSVFDPNIHWLGSLFFTEVIRTPSNNLDQGACYRHIAEPAVRLELATHRLQIQAFNQLSYSVPSLVSTMKHQGGHQ